MGRRDELIAKYADDLKNKCGMTPDMALLTKVTIGCGPSIYNADASTVAGSQPDEIETVKNSCRIIVCYTRNNLFRLYDIRNGFNYWSFTSC